MFGGISIGALGGGAALDDGALAAEACALGTALGDGRAAVVAGVAPLVPLVALGVLAPEATALGAALAVVGARVDAIGAVLGALAVAVSEAIGAGVDVGTVIVIAGFMRATALTRRCARRTIATTATDAIKKIPVMSPHGGARRALVSPGSVGARRMSSSAPLGTPFGLPGGYGVIAIGDIGGGGA